MRKLVLWGYHLDEYKEMFDLSEKELDTCLLEFGCGPTAVNAQLHEKHKKMISCDPLFNLEKPDLIAKTSAIFENMVMRIKREEEHPILSHVGGVEALIAKRREGMDEFFKDYEKGKAEQRYGSFTHHTLPFSDFSFDLALSSHFLFADLDDQDVDFHMKTIIELARVAKEVRIFPLIDRYGQLSPFLGPVLLGLQQEHYGVEVREVNYYLQPEGNAMLRVWAQQCQVG